MIDAKTIMGIAFGIVSATVAVETRYAHDEDLKAVSSSLQEDLKLVSSKLEYINNVQIEQQVAKLARLQAIKNPSPEIQREIEDTKAELERLRNIRDQR